VTYVVRSPFADGWELRDRCGMLAPVAPNPLPGLTYTHVMDDRLSVYLHRSHRLAGRPELSLSDLDGETISLLGGPAGRNSGFNNAIQALFEGSGAEPRFAETEQVFPPEAASEENHVSVSVPVDYPDGAVVSVPLVPPRTLPFEFVQRLETNRAAVRAYARFAAEHLSKWAESRAGASRSPRRWRPWSACSPPHAPATSPAPTSSSTAA
jgi:LysR substrate binding domain